MKVSKIGNKGNMINSMNLSNEFVEANLHDQVQYNVVLKSLGDVNDMTERFVNKHRVVKERTSLGGFRIPAETLKKRVNPSDYIEEYSNCKNPTVNSFSFNPYRNRPITAKNGAVNLSEPLVDDNLVTPYDANRDLGSNLLEIIEKQVQGLKQESLEQQKLMELSRTSKLRPNTGRVEESKVITQYISHNPERVQSIKHVTTQFKPEYMSLEELQKLKEEHSQKMIQIENEFYEKKRKEQENLNRLNNIKDDDRFNKLQKMEVKHMENRKITPEELEDILEHEDQYLSNNKSEKKTMGSRAKSAKGIRRGYSEAKLKDPLDQNEERFVKKYANFLMKKKKTVDDYENRELDSEEGWNKTKIKSYNRSGVVNRPDGLSGYIDQEDYSLYYLSIASNTPRSLSIKSASKSRSRSHSKSKSVPRKKKTRSQKKNKNPPGKFTHTKKSTGMNSHLAFIKLIFNLLDKEKTRQINKTDIISNLNLEESIIKELGFLSETEFKDGLQAFPTASSTLMSEQELIAFFLSRSELAEQYLHNYKMNNEENNMYEENNFNFYNRDEVNQQAEDYPGLANNQMDFLKYASTEDRLEKLRESLNNSSSLKDFNRSLTNKLKDKIRSDSQKSKSKVSKISKGKVEVRYKDYRDFLKKYRTKNELNFTIPQPFEFLKHDYAGKKLKKMEEILQERKQKEDEILGYRFKANDLKREMFISQFENIIEAEITNRKMRTEKIKEKIIQNMRPFSFYEQDERRFKERLDRKCEPPQFPPFKANAVKWTSQVNLYDDILKKMEVERQARIEQRKMETSKAAKLPPRMEMHEKKKKQQDQEIKLLENTHTKQRSKSFKARPVKNFAKAHESFINTLEKKKSMAKPTEPMPFNFHEPKKKASLRGYLDKENDPQIKNPQFKNNILDIIKKIQQKPKIEPASTKSLNLLMATRRKDLEEKQRKDEERVLEDKLRKEKQDRLKERVVSSKSLVNNTKALEEKRSKQQEDFKRNLQDKKDAYQQELARRLQRVYNKPLMFEGSTGKTEKFSMNKNMKDKLNDILYNNEEEVSDVNKVGASGIAENDNDDELYEGKFE